jgi:hypothetical protein
MISGRQVYGGTWVKRARKPRVSYCRDFKKEGLTRPREIVRTMLEALKWRFSKRTSAFDHPGFFDNWDLIDLDGSKVYPERGTGLGMCNALVTLMQIILEKMTTNRWGGELLASLYLNDDAVLIFQDQSDAQEYATIDRENCRLLDLSFKEKASFISYGSAVFCEQYHSHWMKGINKKYSFQVNEALLPLCAANASHAKSLCSSMNIENLDDSIREIPLIYWGWVCYRNEWNRPTSLGGWWKTTISGVDMSYHNKDGQRKTSAEESAGWWATHETELKFCPWARGRGEKNHPTRSRYSDSYCDLINLPSKIDKQSMFRPKMNGRETKRAWVAFETQLKKNFSYAIKFKKILTWEEIWFKDQTLQPKSDIIAPRGVMKSTRPVPSFTDKDLELTNPYRPTTAEKEYSEFVHTNGRNEYTISVRPNKIKLGPYRFHWQRGNVDIHASEQTPVTAAWHFKARAIAKTEIVIWNAYTLPSSKILPYWHDPFAVQLADDLVTYSWDSPYFEDGVLPEAKVLLLEKRRKVWGKDLTRDEWIKLGKIVPQDMQLARAVHCYSAPIFWKFWYGKFLEYPGLGAIQERTSILSIYEYGGARFKQMRWCIYNEVVREGKSTNTGIPEPIPFEKWYSEPELVELCGKINDYTLTFLKRPEEDSDDEFIISEDVNDEIDFNVDWGGDRGLEEDLMVVDDYVEILDLDVEEFPACLDDDAEDEEWCIRIDEDDDYEFGEVDEHCYQSAPGLSSDEGEEFEEPGYTEFEFDLDDND